MNLTHKQPHVEIWNSELYGGGKQFTDFPVGGKGAFALCVLLMNGHSRGTVKLSKDDPLGAPVVVCIDPSCDCLMSLHLLF